MLNEEQRRIGRRNFIRAVATIPPTGALLWQARRMRPVRTAIVGCGGQGGVLIENAPTSHMQLVAMCDISPDNFEKGLNKIRTIHDPKAQGYTNFDQMLERRDIEAVLIAAPLWMHAPLTIAALEARKHVFCEKMMHPSIDGCLSMIKAAQKARRTLQIGHQRNANPLYQEAYALIQAGVIGDVYHIRALWHRNGDWRRPVPELDFDPRPHGYPSLEHLKNWRLYKKFSLGLLSERGSHQLQIVNWFADGAPTSVYGSGGTYRFKDGREIPDHLYLTYEYPDDLTFTYSSIQSNRQDHYYEQIMGTEGTIVLSGERQAMLFSEGKKNSRATQIEVEAAKTGAPTMSASESRLRDAAGSQVSAAASKYSPLRAYHDELAAFCHTIRHRAPNLCDGIEGMNASSPLILGAESIEKGEKLDIPPQFYYSA